MSAIHRGGRRERVRAATVQEIKVTARRLLVDEGAQGVTLRAIAREMGMTAPGLYRYFPSHEDLWTALCLDVYGEIADAIEAELAELAELPGATPVERLFAAASRFRRWAVEHPREFGMVFGMPLPGVVQGKDLTDPEHLSGMRFALVFTRTFGQVWQAVRFAVPADEEISAELAEQLAGYQQALRLVAPDLPELPLGALLRFLQAWVQLYGIVTMEVFGHLAFCLADVDEFFEAQLALIGQVLGLPGVPDPPG